MPEIAFKTCRILYIDMKRSLRARLQAFDRKSAGYDRRTADAFWRFCHGKGTEEQFSLAMQEKAKFVSESGYPELLRENLQAPDPRDRREITVRHNALLVSSVKAKAGKALHEAGKAQYQFRVKVGGEELDMGAVSRILSTSEDRKLRERVWRTQEQSLELAPSKESLASELNRASRQEGSPTFIDLLMRVNDTTADHVRRLIRLFEAETSMDAKSFRKELTGFSGLKRLKPWDVPFYMTRYLGRIAGDAVPKDPKAAMGMLKRTLKAMGFARIHGKAYLKPSDIDRPPFTFDIAGGEGYAPEQCSMNIAPGVEDYRVFINPDLSPTGLSFMRTLLLEAGHVLHYDALNRLKTRNAFKWDNDSMRHAIAMLFDSLMEDEKWLRDVAGLGAREASELSKLLRMKKLMMARGLAADTLFEAMLYLGEEPGAAFREVQELFAGKKIRYQVERHWAWHPHLAYNPGGQLSYTLGYANSLLIAKDMRSRFGSLVDKRAAEYLVDNHFTGYEVPWVRRMSGLTADMLQR